MIIIEVGFNEFCDAFSCMGRKEQFSYEAKKVLFNHIEECYADSTWELDVIALCCDYSEMTYEELANDYNSDGVHGDKEEFLDYLRDHTIMLEVSEDLYILQGF